MVVCPDPLVPNMHGNIGVTSVFLSNVRECAFENTVWPCFPVTDTVLQQEISLGQ